MANACYETQSRNSSRGSGARGVDVSGGADANEPGRTGFPGRHSARQLLALDAGRYGRCGRRASALGRARLSAAWKARAGHTFECKCRATVAHFALVFAISSTCLRKISLL